MIPSLISLEEGKILLCADNLRKEFPFIRDMYGILRASWVFTNFAINISATYYSPHVNELVCCLNSIQGSPIVKLSMRVSKEGVYGNTI